MIIDVKVKLKTKESTFVMLEDLITEQEYYVAHLKSPPVDGKANQELIALVSDYFHIKKWLIKIISWEHSRIKKIEIKD